MKTISLFCALLWLGVAPVLSFASPVSLNGKLRVNGNNLVNACGTTIQLRGYSSHGIQWFNNCLTANSLDYMANNGADVFRIAMYVNEQGYLTDPTLFTNRVNTLVTEAANRGMYCIIDWHILNPGDPNISVNDAKTFWAAMATAHKGKAHVIYEICNEPNTGVSWATIKTYANQVIPVIRAIDPDTIIIVGTPDWSSLHADVVSAPLTQYTNIMYAYHFYAGSHPLANLTPYVGKLPIFATEWGVSNSTGNGGDNYTVAQQYMDYFRTNNISWCNWSYCDKSESTAGWKSGTCSANNFVAGQLSQSGVSVFGWINNPADSFTACGGSGTSTFTPTRTRTMTPSPTRTLTPTQTSTWTNTSTVTRTSTATFSPTQTSSFTSTATHSSTLTSTRTNTPTLTDTATLTPTRTPTRTATSTPSSTRTSTPANTATLTATLMMTSTSTRTHTPVNTATATSSWTPTNTFVYTATNSSTASATSSPTNTAVNTVTNTATTTAIATYTASFTPTLTLSATASFTPTDTWTPTITHTGTQSPSSTWTSTGTATSSFTPTRTFTATESATWTATPTATSTSTATSVFTATPTHTAVWTSTSTSTPTDTHTLVYTVTSTNTSVWTSTPTVSFTTSATWTSTLTVTASNTMTPTATWTFTWTRTPTWTPTPTGTWTPTHTWTATSTPVWTNTFTATSTPEVTPLAPMGTPVVVPNPIQGPGPVRLYFSLSDPAGEVRLTVVTVANRKMLDTVLRGPFTTRACSVLVDLDDAHEKPLANGLYYFYVSAEGNTRTVGKFVVIR
jgi:hypothetical protein